MRELKFRAWYYWEGAQYTGYRMLYSGDLKSVGKENASHFTFEVDGKKVLDVMQYTGIKDDTQEEIYENDIVRIEDFIPSGNPISFIGIVKYRDGQYVVDNEQYGMEIPLFDETRSILVIGNVYEGEN